MVYAATVVGDALKARGLQYVFGVEVRFSDLHPKSYDCSELVEVVCNRLGVRAPDGSWNQLRWCQGAHRMITIQQGIRTQGALLFEQTRTRHHVAFSLGNGSTIEARGRAYGVNTFSAYGRPWTHAALIPGVSYARPPIVARPGHAPLTHPWLGRYITQPPAMHGGDVLLLQRELNRRWGGHLREDSYYGPASEATVRHFQSTHGLTPDGVVGPKTWGKVFG